MLASRVEPASGISTKLERGVQIAEWIRLAEVCRKVRKPQGATWRCSMP